MLSEQLFTIIYVQTEIANTPNNTEVFIFFKHVYVNGKGHHNGLLTKGSEKTDPAIFITAFIFPTCLCSYHLQHHYWPHSYTNATTKKSTPKVHRRKPKKIPEDPKSHPRTLKVPLGLHEYFNIYK